MSINNTEKQFALLNIKMDEAEANEEESIQHHRLVDENIKNNLAKKFYNGKNFNELDSTEKKDIEKKARDEMKR